MFNRMKRKVSFFVALVATFMLAANVQAAYTIKFADMQHCTWTAQYKGSAFTGGDVEVPGQLIVNFTANPSWRFTDNDGKTLLVSKDLTSSDFSGGVYTVTEPSMKQPGFKMEVRYDGDGSSAKVIWEDKSGDLKTYRLMVSGTEEAGNPLYWKNAYNTTKTEQIVSGLAVGHKYYAHLQGGVDADNMSPEVFTREFYAQPNIMPCGFRFYLKDSYGDGWNGAYIKIEENGETTEITLEDGTEGWAEYISSGQDAKVTWESGSYDDEISFSIFAGDGEELVYIEDAGYELSDGTVMKSGVLCDYPCKTLVTNLDFTANAEKTEYTVTWDATGAENFQVAVLQKVNPTEAELEKAAKNVAEKSYKISGKANAVQHVYVRAICDDGSKGGWTQATICDPILNTLEPKDIFPKVAKKIALSATDKGVFMANAVGFGSDKTSWNPFIIYNFTLSEDTKVMFSTTCDDDEYTLSYQLFQDPGDGGAFVNMGTFYGGAKDIPAGNYYLALTHNKGDNYAFKMTKAAEPQITEIASLNFFDAGDFTKAQEVAYAGYTLPAKTFSYTPAADEDIFVQMNVGTSDKGAGILCVVYENDFNTGYASFSAPGYSKLSLAGGNTYYFQLLAVPFMKAKLTDTYQLLIAAQSSEPTQTKRVNLDAHEFGRITKDDIVNELSVVGKVYEFILKEQTPVALSIEVLGEQANDENLTRGIYCYIYKGEISGTAVAGAEADDIYWDYKALDGEASGTHYYAVLMSAYGVDFDYRVDLKAKVPADNIKGKQTIELNKGYQSALSSLDPFRNNGEGVGSSGSYGSVEYYTVHLEASKRYHITVHKLMDISTDKVNSFGTTVLDPTKTGTFTNRTVMATSYVYDDWQLIDFTPTATGDYTLVFGAVQWKQSAQDSLAYEFEVSEVEGVLSKWSEVTKVASDDMPYKNEGLLTGNPNYLPNSSDHFQENGTTWIQQNGAYDALRLNVQVLAGDSLYVEFGGDDDVAIYVYPGTTTPMIFDEVPYAYPYEKAAVKNNTSSDKAYAVICTYNSPRVSDAPYYVRVAKSANDLATATATAKLNQTYVTIPADGGIADAQAALEQLVISAVDGAGTAIGTIVNRGDMWNVNLNEKKASYELNDSDLPLGYKFAKSPTFLQATIRFKDVHIDEVIISSEQDGAVRKVLRNGLIMIDTPYGSFDIMGRRVR